MLLKVGRHLRPRPHFKLIIAREDGENNFLSGYRRQFTHIRVVSHGGPLTLVDGDVGEDDLHLAARLTARYSQGRDADQVQVEVTVCGGESRLMSVTPYPADDIPKAWYI
jgi:predicted ribosome quality control (RQC) complex YloA/Tae2 family protein